MATNAPTEGGHGFIGSAHVVRRRASGHVTNFIRDGHFTFFFTSGTVAFNESYGGTVFDFVGVKDVSFFFVSADNGRDYFVRRINGINPSGSENLLNGSFRVSVLNRELILHVRLRGYFAPFGIEATGRGLTIGASKAGRDEVRSVEAIHNDRSSGTFIAFGAIRFSRRLVRDLFAFVVSTTRTISTPAAGNVSFVSRGS